MKKLLLLFVLLLVITGLSCKKKQTDSNSNGKLFTFNSLTKDKDTILQGNVTNIRANITGTGTFAWSSNAGDIFGSGSVVLFGASTCCVGGHTITCIVTDKNHNSETKSISVFVKQ
ncbi:MAG TPA: hypothetical protein VN026_09585 [Bacteroidia bacterium]|nr:hypothetical protein [Bacteroidia bacterium]